MISLSEKILNMFNTNEAVNLRNVWYWMKLDESVCPLSFSNVECCSLRSNVGGAENRIRGESYQRRIVYKENHI
jgi:hypothetical protein